MGKKRGRPKIIWTERDYKVLEGLCGIMCTNEEICDTLQLDWHTLDRLCQEHYKKADGSPMDFSTVKKKYAMNGKISLRRAQFRQADKSTTMAIWLGKQYLGQSDRVVVAQAENEIDPLSMAFKMLEGDEDGSEDTIQP